METTLPDNIQRYLAGEDAGGGDPNAPDADDFCIVVAIEHALPSGVAFPSVYKGLKVYTEIRPGMPSALSW